MKLKYIKMKEISRKKLKKWCPHCKLLTNRYNRSEIHACGFKVISSEIGEGIQMEGWNIITSLEDCPPVNKKVLIVHSNKIYTGIFQKDGGQSYCWQVEDDRGIQWIDTFEADLWRDLPLISKRKNYEAIWS